VERRRIKRSADGFHVRDFACAQDHPNVLNIYEIWETQEICSIVTQ